MTEVLPVGNSPYTFLTAKERDSESNLDYFGARYFSGAQGRFTSVDVAGPELTNPQTLNKYQYVLNNPLKYIEALRATEEAIRRYREAVERNRNAQ